MTRQEASKFCREKLDEHGLKDWSVRLNQNADSRYLGLCSYKDKCIILNAHHIDIHPDPDIRNTILHEIAHALMPKHGHDDDWASKAREIGCDNTQPCSNLSLSPDIIDAIRSGATIEVTYEEEVIRKPKYTVTRLQDKCEVCGKVAKSKKETLVESNDPVKPDIKIIELECGHFVIKNIPKGTPFHLFTCGGEPDCKHEWDKNKCLKCGAYRPYQFQIDGMRFLEAGLAVNKGAACFDEMGLGKTIQCLGVIKFHPELWPVLYIVKSGTKYQWSKQIINWCGPEFTPQIINSSKDFLIPGLRSYIIGYDMLVPKQRKMKSGKIAEQGFDITKFNGENGSLVKIKTVVEDECQQIKNPDSTRTQQVRRVVKDKKVIPLSGTPWKNRGSELFPVFNMLDPVKFWSQEQFIRQWVDRYWEGNRLKEGGIRYPDKFREFTKDICIRRERQEVMKELPVVNRTKYYAQMNEVEQDTYEEEEDKFVAWYNEAMISGEELNGMNILAKMARMRHLIALAKIPQTVEFTKEFIEDTDRKLVIFVHHKDVAQFLLDELHKEFDSEFPILNLSSDMNPQVRFEMQEKFNESPKCIMVASTLAAGEGINLQTCADCVMHERQWNPANEEQAEGRFIRIGQTAESVNAVYVEAEGSIDTHLDAINERKRIAFHATMNRGEAPRWNETSFAHELASSIVAAHNKRVRDKQNAAKILDFNKKKVINGN